MKVGIVAEGPADVEVLRNILKGKLGIERKDTAVIRPKLHEDQTDRVARAAAAYRPQAPDEFSNWSLVLEECRTRTKIEDFLQVPVAETRIVVIHIDTAEAHLPGYDVPRPDRKAPDYGDRLRALVVAKLDGLLGAELVAGVRHAVAVEETDAWVLTIYDDQDDRDTGVRPDPKKRLRFVLERKASKGKTPKGMPSSFGLSSAFRDPDLLEKHAERNRSLRLFVDAHTPAG
jgi:hypothetical protein